MKSNPRQEQLSVPEIFAGLEDFERFVGIPSNRDSPLFPFKVACEVHERVSQGPFGVGLAYQTPPFRECLMFIAAAMDLVRYFRSARHHTDFKKLRPHLGLISDGFFGIAGTYGIQMTKGSRLRSLLTKYGAVSPTNAKAEDAARKTIELMLAMAALNSFEGVEVEDPENSSPANPNPDLIVRHKDKGFGIACKSITSSHEESFMQNVEKGISQLQRTIEAGKADRRCGVVLLDVSALLDHEKLYVPQPGYCWPGQAPGPVLTEAVTEKFQEIFGPDPTRSFHDIIGPLFKGHALPAGVLIYAHGLMLCEKDGAVSPVYQKALRLSFGGDTSSLGKFNKRLNLAIHCQLG